MSEILILPRLGETMETGRVSAWLKQKGDRFQRGETIVEIESDKTVVELPALEDGTIEEILAEQGAEIPVGGPLCRYRRTGTPEAAPPAEPKPSEASPTPAAKQVRETKPALDRPAPASPDPSPVPAMRERGARRRATPKARAAARAAGIDLESIGGSGRRGRIEVGDIQPATGGSSADLAMRSWGKSGGARIALLHGFGGDSQSWAGFAARLVRDGAEVLAPDLPGHGATVVPARDLDDLARPVAAWLRERGDTPIDLVGHSLGAAVAVAAATAAKGAVRSLTLIAPAGFGPEIDIDFVHGMATVRHAGALAHLLRRLAIDPPNLSEAQLAAMVTANSGRLTAIAAMLAGESGQRLDLIGPLAALDLPVRIVWGLEDRIIPWTQAANTPSRIPVHFIRGAGHMVHWDRPEALAMLLRNDDRPTNEEE